MHHDPLVVSLKQKLHTTTDVSTKRRGMLPYAVLLLLIAGCAAGGYYGYLFVNRSVISEGGARSAETNAAAEIEDTITRVSELIMLPEGEEPTIATVTDPDKLKDQEFFRHAKPGYRVLLYTKARKAYLYDPVSHRLIEVAPITTELQ